MNRRAVSLAIVLAASQAAMADQACAGGAGLPERVLHFPREQSVGHVHIIDERQSLPEISREFHPGYVFAPVCTRWISRIPAGKPELSLCDRPERF
jgi:hypothetical protein